MLQTGRTRQRRKHASSETTKPCDGNSKQVKINEDFSMRERSHHVSTAAPDLAGRRCF